MNYDIIAMIPAMTPPPGQTSNFDDPESMQTLVMVVAVSTMSLTLIVVTVRIYTKAVILSNMGIEDYFAILAACGIVAWDSTFLHDSLKGASRHFWDVRAIDVPYLAYMNYLGEILYAVTMWAAKCSIMLQLKRIFCSGQSRDYIFWSIHGLLFVNTAYNTAALFSFIFQCSPREKAWNVLLEGQCINVAAAGVVSGAVNLFLDLGILVVPLLAICHLQMPLKRKIGTSAVFGVGILTCGIAVLGVVLRVPMLYDPDLSWILTKVGIWTMVEYFGTIVIGCMPSFPRFFLYIRGEATPGLSVSGPKASTGKTLADSWPSAPRKIKQFGDEEVGVAITTDDASFMELEHVRKNQNMYLHNT
ncbi:hypothetical protein QBC35DRAFT_443000 [Podospora australis]|uniref:Rhodopsin domain-containing protein n=1 Tax=Podospora australis TaxID=1536484 RepID=A0AAN6WNS5_9PEZI|nr:hypothetical protein QBC35DRAFT_443000 [Podospora australis]